MKRYDIVLIFLILLLILAACGGTETGDSPEAALDEDVAAEAEVAEDLEATGSESSGGILPTPFAGAKVSPTRNSTAVIPNQIDVFFLGTEALLSATDVNAIAAALENRPEATDVQYAAAFYGPSSLIGATTFSADADSLAQGLSATVSAQPAQPLAPALAAALMAPGWRADSQNRLLIVYVDQVDALPDTLLAELAREATAGSIQVFPIVAATVADSWSQLALQSNGALLLENTDSDAVSGNIVPLLETAVTNATP